MDPLHTSTALRLLWKVMQAWDSGRLLPLVRAGISTWQVKAVELCLGQQPFSKQAQRPGLQFEMSLPTFIPSPLWWWWGIHMLHLSLHRFCWWWLQRTVIVTFATDQRYSGLLRENSRCSKNTSVH